MKTWIIRILLVVGAVILITAIVVNGITIYCEYAGC